jgi:hypothetical protein
VAKFKLKISPVGRAKLRTPGGTVIFIDGLAKVGPGPVADFLRGLGHVEEIKPTRKRKTKKQSEVTENDQG